MTVARSSVCAVIVNWHGASYLPRCIDSLARSSAAPQVVVVDNASTDESVRYLRKEHPEVEVIASDRNLGYAGGANAGIRATTAEYVMIMNPDVILRPDHLEALLRRMDADASIGAAQGKLYQVRPDDYIAGRTGESTTIDSAGHAVRRTRMVYDIGQGEIDDGRFDEERSVFSACGAALLLRREMLEDIAEDGEYFDESFFAYKEDIDLCWRARLRGWDIRYVPEAIGYHVRGWAGDRAPSPQTLPLIARKHSWKNHYLLILKNDRALDALLALPFLLGWEVLRQGHALLRDRKVYAAYGDLLRLLPRTWRRRRRSMARRRVSGGEMRRWFGSRRGFPAGTTESPRWVESRAGGSARTPDQSPR